MEQLVEAERAVTNESVLSAMEAAPRHEFIPEHLRGDAYKAVPLPIGYDQTISQPYIVGLMLEQLQLQDGSKVLEIGTGSGYQTAVLCEMGSFVYSIEIVDELAYRAVSDLSRLGYRNFSVRIGDGYFGWPEAAPFDAITVTCAPDQVPAPLVQQLREGGRLIIPVGPRSNQELYLYEKSDGELKERAVLPVRFVPMTGRASVLSA